MIHKTLSQKKTKNKKKKLSWKRTGGVAQGVCPEFKPQYWKKQKQKKPILSVCVNCTDAVCDQKILVFVLQMEKSKQSMWMEWGRIALLKEGESPILSGEERKEEGMMGTGGVCWQRESFSFSGAFKTYTTPWGAGPGGSHPIMNKWGGAWAVPSQVRVVWPIPRQPTWALNFSCKTYDNLWEGADQVILTE
jgi:hypothetical protein